jgi:hypothetical protein
MRSAAPAGAAVLLALLIPATAEAHRIEVDSALLADGRFHVEVFYSDGRPARKAEIIVRDSSGNEVARGSCNSEGIFEFPAPPGIDLEVEARHEGGHRAVHKIHAGGSGGESGPAGKRGQIPYAKLAIGVALIVVLAAFLWWALRKRHAS